jgi:nicotinamidase-related amidase
MSDVTLNPATTALVLIDLQRAVVARQTAPHSSADVVKRSVELLKRFRAAGATVVLVHVDIGSFVRPVADEPMMPPGPPPPPANASEFVDELDRQPGDLIITKRSWDAFVGTDLEPKLRQRNIRTIVLGGISTNQGVESTLRTAAALGFEVLLVEDATASGMGEEAHRFAITKIFPRLARIRKSNEIQLQS